MLAVEVGDHPGGLADVLAALDACGINIEYMYAFPRFRGDKAILLFRFTDPDAAIALPAGSRHQRLGQRGTPQIAGPRSCPFQKTIAKQLENASWIRRMFEEGVRLKRERGADAVFDFSLGNPDVEPPRRGARCAAPHCRRQPSRLAWLYAQSRLSAGARGRRQKAAHARPAWNSPPKTSS